MRGGSWFVLASILAFVGGASAQEAVTYRKDVVYGKAGDVELKMDVAMPAKGTGPFPAVVCVHGGAWQQGHRNHHFGTIRQLAESGFVACTITYRLAPKHKFPAQIEDVKCAIRFCRAKAGDYKIDPKRIAVLGDSAGGHLALLAGLSRKADGFEGTGGWPKESSDVQAVVNYYGPTNFQSWRVPDLGEIALKLGAKKDSNMVLADFLGTSDRKAAIMAKVSPITYVRKDAPPILSLHGTFDHLVPDQQARELHAALKQVGATERLEIIDFGLHGFDGSHKQRAERAALQFLKERLK